jgi:hypothetical protein
MRSLVFSTSAARPCRDDSRSASRRAFSRRPTRLEHDEARDDDADQHDRDGSRAAGRRLHADGGDRHVTNA